MLLSDAPAMFAVAHLFVSLARVCCCCRALCGSSCFPSATTAQNAQQLLMKEWPLNLRTCGVSWQPIRREWSSCWRLVAARECWRLGIGMWRFPVDCIVVASLLPRFVYVWSLVFKVHAGLLFVVSVCDLSTQLLL